MQNRKLINVLKSFSPQELRRFKKFLESPFFNESDNILSLFSFLQSFSPKYEQEALNTENAFAFIFPHKPYNENVINKLSSKLFRLTEQFIIQLSFQKQTSEQELSVLKFYNERSLQDAFQKQVKNIRKLQHKTAYRNSRFYHRQYLLDEEIANFSSKNDPRKGDVHFQATNNALDTYYLANKLMLLGNMLNRQRSVNIDYDCAFMEEILVYIPTSIYKDNPTVQTWFQALLLLKYPEETAHYEQLKKLLYNSKKFLPDTELRILYTYLENASKRIFKDEQAYYQEIFELYQNQIEKDIIYIDKYLLAPIFKNIVTVSLRLGKYDWANSFIEESKKRLPAKVRNNSFNYNLANLYFHKKNYEQASNLLLLMKKDKDIYMELSVRRMYLQIYYELQEFDILDANINSFKVFIHRHNEMASSHKKANQQFVNFLGRIIRLLPDDRKSKGKLIGDITDMALLAEREWLLSKLEEL